MPEKASSRPSSEFQLLENEDLSKHSYIRIGGRADFFVQPATHEELAQAIMFCRLRGLRYRVVGGGCNVLFDDAGYRGCIICMSLFEKNCFEVEGRRVRVSAGMRTSRFVRKCDEHGLSGMEFLSFIPGTIGGTVVMNAGCMNYTTGAYEEVADFIQAVEILEDDHVVSLSRDKVTFSYRFSSLKEKIVLFAEFLLQQERVPNFKKELAFNYRERAKKMPMQYPSLGSMFKNPAGCEAAGKLIEKAGLKGCREGGIVISPQHANVFENHGGGTSRDVLILIEKAKAAVRERFGVEMELEIEYIA